MSQNYRNQDDFPLKRTTAAELIAALQKLPPDIPIMVYGYEGGYHDCGFPVADKVKLNVNSEWYYGPHENADFRDDENNIVDVYILKGEKQ